VPVVWAGKDASPHRLADAAMLLDVMSALDRSVRSPRPDAARHSQNDAEAGIIWWRRPPFSQSLVAVSVPTSRGEGNIWVFDPS